MKVWLDDLRPMPEGYTHHVKTAQEAIDLLDTDKVEVISLDHDLGGDDPKNNGYEVAKFIEYGTFYKRFPKLVVHLHTANPVGRAKMQMALNIIEKWKKTHS